MRRREIAPVRLKTTLAVAVGVALAPLLAATAADSSGRAAMLEAAIATITTQELHGHVGLLAEDALEGREAGTRGSRAAARFLEGQIESHDLRPAGDNGSYVQRFRPAYQNLLGVLPGVDPDVGNEYVLIGAHYDHVGYGNSRNSNGPIGYIHNGADDNASGVAALLEIIDALHRTEWQPRRSILFAFWDGEEIDLLGSRHWVRQPTVPISSVKLAINIDMVGRLRDGRLEIGGTRTAPGLRRLMSASQLPQKMKLDYSWEYKENSDHWPLFEAGVPSMLVHTGLHDDYHTPHDDVEKLNVAGIRDVSAYLLDTLCRVADADALPAFRPASRAENPEVQRRREAPLPASPPRLGVTWSWSGAEPAGVVVSSIVSGSPAQEAGLQVGDKITKVDGLPIRHRMLLSAATLRAKDRITVEVVREGSAQELTIPLVGEATQLGLSWREDDAEPGTVFITRVVPFSPAARAGLKLYDRLYALEGRPFADGDELLDRLRTKLAEEPEFLQFEVESSGLVRAVTVDMRLPTGPEGDATM